MCERLERSVRDGGVVQSHVLQLFQLSQVGDARVRNRRALECKESQILELAFQKLKPGGRLVANMASIDLELPSEVLEGIEAIHRKQPNPAP